MTRKIKVYWKPALIFTSFKLIRLYIVGGKTSQHQYSLRNAIKLYNYGGNYENFDM